MDSRLRHLCVLGSTQISFWGIVWTAGFVCDYQQYQHAKVFGGIVWTAGTRPRHKGIFLHMFLGDSVDSRPVTRNSNNSSEKGFWGIVWTAGLRFNRAVRSASTGFWGIVWTAGKTKPLLISALQEGFWGIVWTAGMGVFPPPACPFPVFGG